MTPRHATALNRALLISAVLALIPSAVMAQGRGRGQNRGRDNDRGEHPVVTTSTALGDFTLSVELRTQIRDFYEARPASNVEALPPGIRRNLARGKPLPPGIAKKSAPPELAARVHLHDGYELVEVGLDVFLVEVATGVVHDVLMDIIR